MISREANAGVRQHPLSAYTRRQHPCREGRRRSSASRVLEEELQSLSSEDTEEPEDTMGESRDEDADMVEKVAIRAAVSAPWLLHNPRSNLVHFAQVCPPDAARAIRMWHHVAL